jgi:hypothetical protein
VLNDINSEIQTTEKNLKKEDSRMKRYAKLLGDELKGDSLILSEYENAKNNIINLKSRLTKLTVEKDDLTNTKALKNYKKQMDSVDGETDFKTLKTAVDSIIEDIRIDSKYISMGEENAQGLLKRFNNKYLYDIVIHYKGLSEVTFVNSYQPYTHWTITRNTKLVKGKPITFGGSIFPMILSKEDIIEFD